MPNMRHHFNALLTKINPPDHRVSLASQRVGEIRDWLREHEFPTVDPHTRLSGSYARSTAIELIPDVDTLLFIPDDQEERTPNSVLLEVYGVLQEYPDAGAVNVTGQRRSVRLELPDDDLCFDIVPSIAPNGLAQPLLIPDRPQEAWIATDPLGYAERLSRVNQANGGKLVPLIKMLKAWRDEHMVYRRPKSYVLEVILLYALEDGEVVLCDQSAAENFHDALDYIADKYGELMDHGAESPRIRDPQITDTFITKGWSRSHFETFMRRIRGSRKIAADALIKSDDEAAAQEWARVFGTRWPTEDEIRKAVRAEAHQYAPGRTAISSSGRVFGGVAAVATRATTYHGA